MSVWIGRRLGTWPLYAFEDRTPAQAWASDPDPENRTRTIQEYVAQGVQVNVKKIVTNTYIESEQDP